MLKGSGNDILTVLNCSNQKINVRYTLNDDFSVMAMVAGGFCITIMSDLIVRNTTFRFLHKPFDFAQPFLLFGVCKPERQSLLFSVLYLSVQQVKYSFMLFMRLICFPWNGQCLSQYPHCTQASAWTDSFLCRIPEPYFQTEIIFYLH